jgi:hypothetical protein
VKTAIALTLSVLLMAGCSINPSRPNEVDLVREMDLTSCSGWSVERTERKDGTRVIARCGGGA